ncbi:MAG: Rab family GTPase [Candidatus Hermodarchaeia archaeon]|jgi:GTPase SAR1 family protein
MDWPRPIATAQPLTNIKWALKILFVGDQGVGKTRLMCGFSDGVYIDGFRTKLGSSFGAKQFNLAPARVQLQIWNLADSPNLVKLRSRLIRGGAGVVYVFSLTDKASFDNVINWVDEVRQVLGIVPSVLVGTRQETRKRRRVTKREAKQLAKHLGISYIEVSQEQDPVFEKALQDMVVDILKDA